MRLLPADTEMLDFWKTYYELERADPYGWIEEVRQHYVATQARSGLYVDIGGPPNITISWAEVRYWKLALDQCMDGLPDAFRRYVRPPKVGTLDESSTRGERFRTVASALAAVNRYDSAVDFYRRSYALSRALARDADNKAIEKAFGGSRPIFAMQRVVVEQGRVCFVADDFTDAFHGSEAERLGICLACDRVFWRKRIDMKGCTIACARVIRTRRSRQRKPTEEQKKKYKINRVLKELGREKTQTKE